MFVKKAANMAVFLGIISALFLYYTRVEQEPSDFACDWNNLELFEVCLRDNFLGHQFGELRDILIAEGFEFRERTSNSDPYYFRKRANNLGNYIAVALVWTDAAGIVDDINRP